MDLAQSIAAIAVDSFVVANGRLPQSVCDPTCGAGGFLIAVADELRHRGMAPSTILDEVLSGVEIDPAAAAAALESLTAWGAAHGHRAPVDPDRLTVTDSAALSLSEWPQRPPSGFDMVVGNPPFLSQLARDTTRSATEQARLRERFGDVGAYADSAALHLAIGAELLAPGGVAAQVQPVSTLSARDAAPIRAWISERCSMPVLWTSDEHHFDAAVLVCVPVLARGGVGAVTRVYSDTSVIDVTQPVGDSWAQLSAFAAGVPDVDGHKGGPAPDAERLSTLATATAGFRDEFYALSAAIDPEDRAESPLLISTGMIDPFSCRWGTGAFRIAGERRERPRVELEALERASPGVAQWARRRLRPKVLVATQTKVIEAIADPDGAMIPLTPVLSVEPHSEDDLWRVAAALSAPPSVARLAALQWGSGRSAQSLRIPARLLIELPLPSGRDEWERVAAMLAEARSEGAHDPGFLIDFGRRMTVAYGLAPDHPVLDWWLRRLPPRLGVADTP